MKRTDSHKTQATPTFDQLARERGMFMVPVRPRGLGEVLVVRVADKITDPLIPA